MLRDAETNGLPKLTARDLLYVVFRRKRLIVAFFVSAVIGAVLYVLIASPSYESTAKLLVRQGRETATLDPTAMMSKTMNVGQSMQNLVKSELEILNSQQLAESVVDSIGVAQIMDPPPDPSQGPPSTADVIQDRMRAARKALQRYTKALKEKLGFLLGDLTPRQRATTKVMASIDIEGVFESNVIMITGAAETRRMAQRIVEELVKFYLAKHLEAYKSSGSYDLFFAQAKELETHIASKQAELEKQKNQGKIVSLDIEGKAVAERIAILQTAYQEAKTSLASAEAKIAAIDAMRSQGSSPSQRWQMRQLVKDEDELAQRNEIAVLRARISTYQKELAAAEEERRRLTESAGRIEQLEHELEIHRATYKTYRESSEKARIDDVLQAELISNISIIESPTYPMEKAAPKSLLMVGLGMIVGLFGGLGLAFVIEYFDQSVKNPEDVEQQIRLPMLATVPFVRPSKIRKLEKKAASASGAFLSGHPVLKPEIPPPFQQPLQALRHRLLQLAESRPGKARLIGVTSSYPREGVSTICRHLATLIAQSGPGRVLLVDANFRDPSAHRAFNTSLQPGLREILADGGSAPSAGRPTSVPRLDVIPAGQPNGDDPSYEGGVIDSVMTEWGKAYDFVIIDMPVCGAPSVARLVTRIDGALLVVEADRVRWQVISRVKAQFEEAEAKLLGIVLNKRRFPIPAWFYRRL